MKILKFGKVPAVLDMKETFYSQNLRVTVDKASTEFIFPKLTLMQSKLLMFLMSQVKASDGDIPSMVCSYHMLAKKVLNCKLSDVMNVNTENFLKSILGLYVKIKIDNPYNKTKKDIFINLFDKFVMDKENDAGEHYFEFDFGKTMKQVLIHGSRMFAEVNSEYVYQFKSIHSIWLYFFLCGKVYHGKDWSFSFPVERVAELLGVPQLGENYKRLNERVLKSAAKEVTEKSDIQVKYNKKKNSKDINFNCHRDKRGKLDKKKQKK